MLGFAAAGLELSVHALLLTASAVAALFLIAVTVRYRTERIAGPLGLLFVLAALWSISVAVRLAIADPTAAPVWIDLRAAAGTSVGVLYLWVVLVYLDRDELLSPLRLAALFAIPVATVLALLTGVRVDLVVQAGETIQYSDPLFGTVYTVVEPVYGPWFYVNALYNYLLIAVAVGLLLRSLFGVVTADVHRAQTVVLLLAIVFPVSVNVGYHVGLLAVDLTASSFVVGLALFTAAIFRYDLFTLVPIARDTAVENMDEGFFVLDRDDRIVDCNVAAAEMVGEPLGSLAGRDVGDVYPQYDQLVEEHGRTAEFSSEIVIDQGEASTHYDVTASPIFDAGDRYVGRVILVQDVTERVERKQRFEERTAELTARTEELERQNERLEEFASVLSHDLRNPLAVAESYLERARTTGDPDDFDAVEESLGQIERFVDDLLTMARQGQTVQEREPIDLAALVREAWDHVETDDAQLTVTTDAWIRCDRTRLLQVFENLFRNSIDHGSTSTGSPASDAQAVRDGGESTTDRAGEASADDGAVEASADGGGGGISVTVGELSGGFYVEDDGPGIPADERDTVFDRGFTTDADGTGLGLSIVKLAIEAHGWSIRVTESDTGGARFEVADVDSLSADGDATVGIGSRVREDLQ